MAQLEGTENGLCFGRLDMVGGERHYVGRIGLADDADAEPLLIDWRAPAARPFYLATAVSPLDVARRRHLRSRGRAVTKIDDEVLAPHDAEAARDGVTGEAALLAALDAGRTGRMSDIVATIQAEQDRIIRASPAGALVVQGGPGTGKTAVALHRAAFLLYTQRETLSRRVVLVVGPNTTFLRYVERVLPTLGETAVLLTTVGELFPGAAVTAKEPAQVSQIKGQLQMADVVAAAIRAHQQVPAGGLAVPHEDLTLRVDTPICRRLRDRARDTGLPHNAARAGFVQDILDALARAYAEVLGADPFGGPNLLLDEGNLADLRHELWQSPAVRRAISTVWPAITPQQLLQELFASPERLAAVAPGLTAEERELLHRTPGEGWTTADIPLLDEAAELLGEDDRPARERAARLHQDRVGDAQGVLDITVGSRATDLDDGQEAEVLSAFDLLDAQALADRHDEADHRTPAERAATDRTWAFGHVIVDEAQELSPMAWRLLMRRCPTRSMTLVGDTAQTGNPAGTSSWNDVLDPYMAGRWRLGQLSRNYRVPAEIMAVAACVLHQLTPAARTPRSVRHTGRQPCSLRLRNHAELVRLLPALVADIAAEIPDRRLAVITPRRHLADLARAVTNAVGQARIGEDPEGSAPIILLDPQQAKGLEFDVVVVTEPDAIVAGSPHGLNDLYVALTRPTQHLAVIHTVPLPSWLAGLRAIHQGQIAEPLSSPQPRAEATPSDPAAHTTLTPSVGAAGCWPIAAAMPTRSASSPTANASSSSCCPPSAARYSAMYGNWPDEVSRPK